MSLAASSQMRRCYEHVRECLRLAYRLPLVRHVATIFLASQRLFHDHDCRLYAWTCHRNQGRIED